MRDRQQPGQPVSARIINQGVEAAEVLDNLSVSGGLAMVRGPRGRHVRLASSHVRVEIGQTSGTITALSGSTAGSGTVTLYKNAKGTLSSTAQTVTAYNLSSTSIASGKWVGLILARGFWWVMWEGC